MIVSLFTVVLLQWLINWRIVPLQIARLVQPTWQAFWCLGIIGWVYRKDWAWVRSPCPWMETLFLKSNSQPIH